MTKHDPLRIWGIPLTPFTFQQTMEAVEDLIRSRRPNYFITANLHYAMLTAADPRRLEPVNRRAAFLVADGKPLVWASRRRLPERVTGSDLVPALCARAAERGYRVFLMGGAPGVAELAARNLTARHPRLQVVGAEAPLLSRLTAREQADLIARIRSSGADLFFAALSQPAGEIWLSEHCEALGVPACVNVGCTLDILSNRMQRAPIGWQRAGLEWAFRFSREPKRLGPRYARNALFALRRLAADVGASLGRRARFSHEESYGERA